MPGAVLHVTNGDSAASTLRQTAVGGAVLPWQDVLHEGPVPAVSPAELREVRGSFLSDRGWGSRRAIRAQLETRDRLFLTALADRRPVVLWFEHDLYDQLQLIQILALAADAGTLELIQVDSFPGRPNFHGLGELTAAELETLWPQRAPVTPEQIALASRAWDAVRAPEPTALTAFLAEDARLRRDVLGGRADRVELLGIDRWVGGTHLVPGAVWRRDGSELVAP